jgi:hypothetical protein
MLAATREKPRLTLTYTYYYDAQEEADFLSPIASYERGHRRKGRAARMEWLTLKAWR